MLSALCRFCPLFLETDYIIGIVYPFVKLFSIDETLCFEIILSFLFNFGQNLF